MSEEIWKGISGYEGLYEISNFGYVKSFCKKTGGSIIKNILGQNGYYKVNLMKRGKRKQPYIHRLVAQAFIPNPENKPEVNHIDGNKLNNHVSNLEWCTSKENSLHCLSNSLQKVRGQHNGNSKLKRIDVVKIRLLRFKGMSCKRIAFLLGFSQSTVSRVSNSLSYRNVSFMLDRVDKTDI